MLTLDLLQSITNPKEGMQSKMRHLSEMSHRYSPAFQSLCWLSSWLVCQNIKRRELHLQCNNRRTCLSMSSDTIILFSEPVVEPQLTRKKNWLSALGIIKKNLKEKVDAKDFTNFKNCWNF